jgi:hypothetical protein
LLFVLGNLAVCALIVGTFVFPALTFFSERDERVADQGKVLARLKAVVAQESNIQTIASDTKTQLQSGEFLSGTNENVISADLQTRIKALTEGAGSRSRTVQALPVRTADHLRYAGSRIDIVGSIQSVQRAVYTIENAKPYLFITAAAIRSAPAANRPGIVEEPAIAAQIDVYGAMQVGPRDP